MTKQIGAWILRETMTAMVYRLTQILLNDKIQVLHIIHIRCTPSHLSHGTPNILPHKWMYSGFLDHTVSVIP